MDRLIRVFSDYYNRQDFRRFQNTLAQKVYETLGTSYSNSDGEVKMVTDMCDTINGEGFEKLQFHAAKIHGARSFVEFRNQDKPTTKELADMVIISIATKDNDIVYEKIAFVQNKKEETENTWKIDQDQLYLLHNFPTFKGEKGVLKKHFKDEVIFQNHSATLGNYGLFQSPGEMILVNALTVYRLQHSEKVSFPDIRKHVPRVTPNNNLLFLLAEHPLWEEMLYGNLKHFPKHGFPFLNFPFLNNNIASFNVYEFVRNWSLFNIGELVSTYGKFADKDLGKFSRIMMRKIGFDGFKNDKSLMINQEYEFENNLAVLIAHLNLDKE